MKFKIIEQILTEGTHYDKDAAKIISDSGLYNLETSQKIIDAIRKEDIHAFVHAPNWLMKYLKGIARMLVDYSQGSTDRAVEFLNNNVDLLDKVLTWVVSNRDSKNIDNEFVNQWSIKDVEDFYKQISKEAKEKSKKELDDMEFNGVSSYDLVPIESFSDFNSKFGGRLTGDGSSDKYAGGGGTAWCHANSNSTYGNWVGRNKMFFVLARKDFKDIPAQKTENNPKDDYGNSLIAILVNKRTGDLEKATLRWNHVGVNSNADNQYNTYAELSQIAGFNVEKAVDKYLEENPLPEISDTYIYTGGRVPNDIKEDITKVIVQDGVRRINAGAFDSCIELTSITIPDSITYIGTGAFAFCNNLKSIDIPNSVTSIGGSMFYGCTKLTNITIPDSVMYISDSAFSRCINLTNITIPNSVMFIGDGAFAGCTELTNVTIGDDVTSIGNYAFSRCFNLTNIVIPNSVISIGDSAFYSCTGLTSVTIPNSVTHIDSTAFYDCSPNLVFHCEKGLSEKVLLELKEYGKVEINESIKNTFKFLLVENINK